MLIAGTGVLSTLRDKTLDAIDRLEHRVDTMDLSFSLTYADDIDEMTSRRIVKVLASRLFSQDGTV